MKQLHNLRPIIMASFVSHSAGLRFLSAVLALALEIVPGSAYGVSCSVSTSGVNFGNYDVFSPAANDAAGNIRVSCSDLLIIGVSYEILISTGNGSYLSRSMTSGSHTLTYNLYTASNYASIWGDGSAGTGKISAGFPLGILNQQRDHTVYGRIPAGQNAHVGSYSDTLTVTVTY
jgi:spore coat protein U-like protein